MINETFAKNVRARRVELGLSQAELAKKSGLSVTSVQHVEQARVWVGLATIKTIAKTLDCTQQYLFRDADASKPTLKEALKIVIEATGLDLPDSVIDKAELKTPAARKAKADITAAIPRDVIDVLSSMDRSGFQWIRKVLEGWHPAGSKG